MVYGGTSAAQDISRLKPLRALHDLEAHPLALIERPEALGDDGRVMDKDVLTPGLGLNEAISLRIVEPLDRSLLRHLPRLLSERHGLQCSETTQTSTPIKRWE